MLDPYFCTDCGDAFPAGDPYLVYPGPGGLPEESIRLMSTCEALFDLRALQLLEAGPRAQLHPAAHPRRAGLSHHLPPLPPGRGMALAMRARVNAALRAARQEGLL